MCQIDVNQYLSNNQRWVKEVLAKDAEYFKELKIGQQPKALLLGCSDSRVSPSQVFGTSLGDFFMHRNIANVVSHTDLNFLSVMQYAVEALGVRDIIVYGHYGCGGIKAAYENKANGLIDNWLANIKDVIRHYKNHLEAIPDEDKKLNRLVELNVIEQLENIKQTSVYKKAAEKGIHLNLHAWVFDLSTGLVRNLKEEVVV